MKRESGLLALLGVLALSTEAQALTFGLDFGSYTDISLGSVPGLPPVYGGLTFKAGDPNTLIIGENANTVDGRFYEIGVTRGAGDHITGFTGTATAIGDVGEWNDGGIAYGPGDVGALTLR